MPAKPRILVTNDDGIYADGLQVLVTSLKSIGEVFVVAPDSERSAAGHAITLSDPIRVKEYNQDGKFFGYATTGTPADCVKLACKCLYSEPFDLVVSGINHGGNTGVDLVYSGTVSAATEGVFMHVPSIAISLKISDFSAKADFNYSAKLARTISEEVLSKGLPHGTLLNINIPALPESEISGIRVSKQGRATFSEEFIKRKDPWNRTYYWLAGEKEELQEDDDADDQVLKMNFVSVTPVRFDLTDHSMLEELAQWEFVRES